ncbi:MAG: hypothetical protein ACJ8GJ_10265 [Vitreoscilla sp.]
MHAFHTNGFDLPPPDLPPEFETEPQVRALDLKDLPALMDLEREKWTQEQAASERQLRRRIAAHADLGLGAFCPWTGRLLASLFMRPVAADFWQHADTWAHCLEQPQPIRSAALFGVSLSSRDVAAVDAILRFFWPRALKGGWRHIYLGSPVPGLRQWLQRHPQGCADKYARMQRSGLPLDPQLRYYHLRGFKEIVCVKPGYFPHERSQDHGVILRGTIPLSTLVPIWRALPLTSAQRVTRQLSSLL